MSDSNDSLLENLSDQNLIDEGINDEDDQDIPVIDEDDDSQEDASESAPEETEEDKQDAIQKAINRKHFQVKEAEAKLEAERQRVAELEAKLNANKSDDTPPEIPELPDPYDEEYEKKVASRDEIIKQHAMYQIKLKLQEAQQQAIVKNQQKQHEETIKKAVESFDSNAEKLNLDKEDLKESENIVGAYVKDPQLATFLLEHEQGPLLVDYLAKNVTEFDKLSGMNNLSQAVHLVTNVLPKALSKTKKTKAPDPIDVDTGRGSGEPADYGERALRGATFK